MNRNGTIRKVCAAVTAVALVFQWSVPFFPSASAAGFVTSIVTRTPSNGLTVPGSSLSFTFQSTNFTGGPVTNPFMAVTVAQSEFTYVTASGGFAQTPLNTFYPTSGFNPPTSATGTISATVQNAYAFWINRALFTIPKSYPHATFDITAVWGAEGLWSNSYTASVKVDVFPHVSSASISKPSIVNNGTDSTDLTVTVVDKNGCSDLQWGSSSLTVDLSAIWGSSAKPADSVSCNGDVATISFNGITSTASSWGNAVIRIVDAAWHVAGSGDSAFWLANPEISTVFIGVQQPSAPVVTVNSPAESSVSVWALDDVTLNWQSSQSGSYAIYAWPSASCWSGAPVISWTVAADSPLISVVPAASFQNGSNTVAVCVTNSEPTLWQKTVSVTKDSLAPTVQIVASPSVIGSGDAKVTFTASESWTYSVAVNGVDLALDGTYETANSEKEVTVPNAAFTNNPGANSVRIRVYDARSNMGEATVSVTKDYTPPSPVASVSLEDCDFLSNAWTECAKLGNPRSGMTGRDFHVSWALPPESESGTFLEYRVFVLPTSVAPNPSVHQILATVSNFSSTGTVISNTFASDSSWTLFPSSGTGEYRAWVYAYKKNGLYSTPVGSSPTTITADAITYPTFASASFVSGTGIALTFSKPLSANLSDYDSFKLASSGNCFIPDRTAWSWAVSVSWSTVVFAVENVASPSKSCGDLSVTPGLVRDSQGLTNEDSVTGGSVSDGQRPAIAVSSPTAWAFIAGNGSFTVLYSLTESMAPASLFAHFTDGSWSTVSAPLSSAASAGNRSVTLTGSFVGLLDWRTYSLVISGSDLAGNSASSNAVSGITYDVTAPSLPVLFSPVSDAYVNVSNVPLTWVGSTDNSSASSSISYEIQVSQYEDFSVMSAFGSVSWWAVSYAMSPAAATNTGYYWRVRATDAGGNVWSWTASARFFFDNVAPTVSTLSSESYLWNVTRSFSGYAKSGDSVEIRTKITDNYLGTLFSTGISANLSAIGWGASSVPSSFVSGNAVWALSANCTDGNKTVSVSASDVAGNVGNGSVAGVCDNTAPSVSDATVTSPSPASYVSGGSSVTIAWNASFYASEASPVANPVTVETSSDGGSNWTVVASSVANTGSVPWTVPNVDVSNFLIRLSATDRLSNTASGKVSVVVDSTNPAVASDALTYPNGGEYLKGSTGTGIAIVWNPSKITDANIADAPISLEYSTNGSDWISIASSLPNSGSYVWPVGSVDSNSVRVRIAATDKAGRVSYDQSDSDFSVDSTLPTVTPDVPPTPPSASFLSNSGFDIWVTGTDVNLAKVSYSLTDGSFYWNASSSSWIWAAQWNDVCVGSAACAGATDVAMPALSDGTSYQFSYRSTDRAGNVKDSSAFSYVADLLPPEVAANVSSGAAFSWSVSLAGTATDARSGVSSVRVSVKRLSDGKYWWGTDFDQVGETSLLVSTLNGYANWTYTGFSIPSGDPEGSQYLLNIKWIDKAYKVNNESSAGAIIVKDSVGPTIASDVWISPAVWEFWKGANAKTLSWNPAKITDAISWVDQASGITVQYATGAGIWNVIANSCANSGSLVWTVPVMDGDVTLRISAKDALGNASAGVVSPMVTVDTLQPQISTVETMDRAASGKIDGLLVTMSEPVRCATLRASDFSVAGIGTPTGVSGCAGTSSTFVLEFAPSDTTASTPWLTYSPAGILEDRAGNLLAPVSKPSVDKAVPRLLSANVFDSNSNGKIDRIVATFSENLSNSTDVTAWTLNGHLAWMSANPVSASVSSASVTLSVAEPTAFETSSGGISVSFAGWALWKDAANNASAPKASLSLGDSAAPKIVSAITREVSGNYAVELGFSEPLSASSFSGISFAGTSTFTGTYQTVNSRTYRFLTADSTSADTAKAYSYAYSGTSVADLSANPLNSVASTPVSDGVAPKALSRVTKDSDSDGKTDSVFVVFSETLNGNVSGVTASVSWYSVASYASSGSGLTVQLTERALPDTDSTPSVQISNVSLADASGNLFASEVSPMAATDGVGPVVTAARYDGSGKVTVTLSETYAWTPSNDWFTFSGTSVSVSSASPVSPTEIELNVTGTVTYGTTSVSAASGKVKDAVGNAQAIPSYSKINASVVINEVLWSSSGSSLTQYVELRNLWPSSIDVSGFKIDYASGNGTSTLTLPASQTIAGNGYYLIAASAPSTLGNLLADSIVPNYVGSLSLAPGQASNLVLKNAGWSVYDRAKANPFPAWSDALVVSMERKDTPGDGLTPSNWYSAQTWGSYFDSVWPKGTPGSANVFDATAPAFTSVSPADGKLFFSGSGISVSYGYSDDVLVSANPVRTFKVEKNDGSGNYSDVTALSVASSGADASSAVYALTPLARGAYRFTFSVSDAAGNSSQSVTAAYVDELSFEVSPSSADIGTLDVGSPVSSAPVVVTVKTVWAPFSLNFSWGALSAVGGQFADWDGSAGYGVECVASSSASASVCDSTKKAASQNGTLENLAVPAPDSNGNLKTYRYEISFVARPDDLTAAGTYQASHWISLSAQY